MSTTTVPMRQPRRTPRWLRIALVVIVVVLAVATIANGAWSLLAVAARHTSTTTTAYPGVRTLTVNNQSGDIDLVSAPAGGPVRVTAKVTRGLDKPTQSAERSAGGALRLNASCPSDFNGVSCNVDYRVAVPVGIRLLVDASAGDVAVRDYTSGVPLRLKSSSGDVDVTGVTAPEVDLKSSAGEVHASAIRSPVVSVDSSAGDVRLDMVAPPSKLVATSSAGDVHVTLPDAIYALDASSSAGDVSDRGIRQDPRSPRKLTVRSSAGDVSVDTGRPHP